MRDILELTADLPPASEEAMRLAEEVRKGFRAEKASAARGAKVFEARCAPCHQIRNVGVVIGPQLDGIGMRGTERILEDLLDPNRNVDAAFAFTTYLLKDGQVLFGLFRRLEGETVVIANAEGKEVVIPRATIQREEKTRSSLMPDNLAQLLPREELDDLLAYLLSEKTPR